MGKKHKIGCSIDDKEYVSLERFLKKVQKLPGGQSVTRSDIIREAVNSYITGSQNSAPFEIDRKKLLMEAKRLRESNLGITRKEKAKLLQAAARELEALSMDPEPSESEIRSTLVEVLLSLQKATGYRRLPVVQAQNEAFTHEVYG